MLSFFKKINLDFLSVFFTFLILYTVLIFLNSSASFFMDDMSVVFSAPNLPLWVNPDHGTLVSFIPNKFLGLILPAYFHLHPQDFLLKFGIYVKCFLFLLIPLFSTLWVFRNKKEMAVFNISFLFLFFLMFNTLRFSIVELAMSTAFYRLTFPVLLWVIFWFYFSGYYINSIKPDKKFFIVCSIFAFLTGNSSDVVSVFSILTFFMLFIYDFISNPQKTFKNKLKAMEKGYYIPFIFLLTGFLMLATNNGFLLQLHIKFSRYPDVTLLNTLPLIFVFIKEYLYQIIWRHIIPISVIIFNLIFLYSSQKYYLKKQAHFVLSLFVSILLFFFALFFAGKTHYLGGFWLQHSDLQFVLHLCLIITAIIPAENVFQIFQEKISQKNIFFMILKPTVICLIIMSFAVNFISYFKISDYYKNKIETLRKNMYLYEKMTIFYWQKGKPAIIPYTFDFSNTHSYMVFNNMTREFEYKENDEMHVIYMNTLHPSLKSKSYIFTYPEKAYKQFIKNGGTINSKELEELNFTNLYHIYQ